MSIISNAKEVVDLVQKIGDTELYRKIVELEGEIIELTREKRELEQRVEELNKSLQIKSKMEWKKPFYYMKGDDVPFCPRCWEVENIAVHMNDISIRPNMPDWLCWKCKNRICRDK